MNKLINNNTDLILVTITVALIGFTGFGITDPNDFITFVSMVASYKFGKSQRTVEPKSEESLG